MDSRHKHRLHSVDNLMQTRILGGEVSDKLQPYRTFLEVEQPASDFLLRLDKEGRPALYEADGGAWKLEAKRNIAAYLCEQLADLVECGSVVVMI